MLNRLKQEKPWLYNAIALVVTSLVCGFAGVLIFNLSGDIIRSMVLTGLIGFGLNAFVFKV